MLQQSSDNGNQRRTLRHRRSSRRLSQHHEPLPLTEYEQKQALRELLQKQKKREKHVATTEELIDVIITRFPGAPRFASMLVDRLMEGDEALARALRQEGF